MTQAHSLCSHLAGSTAQPLCSIMDGGRESFQCMACASETIGRMASKRDTFIKPIVDRVRFDNCGHEFTPHLDYCVPCLNGVVAYLAVIVSMARFSDHHFANRIAKVIDRLRKRHTPRKTKPHPVSL